MAKKYTNVKELLKDFEGKIVVLSDTKEGYLVRVEDIMDNYLICTFNIIIKLPDAISIDPSKIINKWFRLEPVMVNIDYENILEGYYLYTTEPLGLYLNNTGEWLC